MRTIALSLWTAFGLGAVVVGGRGIAADRASHRRGETPALETRTASTATPLWNGGTLSPIIIEAPGTARRLWYGGTLAPIVVQATMPARLSGHSASECPPGGR